MKKLIFIILGALVFATSSFANASHNKVIKCDDIEFEAPNKMGDLPTIPFYYSTKVVLFSFRDGNLFIVAMDATEPTRVRIVISAQLDPKTGQYSGQKVADYGGHQIQLDNGNVTCSVTSH